RDSVSTEDIADTIDALANMGIEVDNSLPPEEQARRDAAFLKRMREREGLPQFTGDGWRMLLRALQGEKAAEGPPPGQTSPAASEEAREPVKRTFMQEMFAGIGPRVRRTRPKIR